MAEGVEGRFVRCPKCSSLLCELPGVSVYRCGGCDAVLRAKKNGTLDDGLLEESDDVKGSDRVEEVNILKGSEVDRGNGNGAGGVGRNCSEGMASDGMPISRLEGRDVSADSNYVKRGKERMRRLQTFDEEYESYTHGLVGNSNWGKNVDLNVVRPEYGNFLGENVREAQVLERPLMSTPGVDLRGVKSNAGGIPARLGNGGFLYHNEGQSSYNKNPNHEQGDMSRYLNNNFDELARMESLGNGRAELIRKLDELKDQLTRSCNVTGGNLDERIGNDHRMPNSTMLHAYNRHHSAYVQEGLISSQGASKQPPQYFGHPAGFIPHTDGCCSRGPDVQPQRGQANEFLHYPDSRRPEMIHGTTQQCQTKYREQLCCDQFPGYYGDVKPDLFMLHRHENFFHQSACSCVHCCEKNWRMPPNVDHLGYQNQRSQNGPSNPNFHQNLNPVLHQPRGHHSGGSNLPPLHPQQNCVVLPNDLDSENDGLSYHRPRKFVVAHRRTQRSYPIAGGAPFMTCDNCFELLKLSRKHISLAKNQQKMKCGACSSIILYDIGNKGFFVSPSPQVDQVPTQVDEGSDRGKLISFYNIRDNSQRSCAAAEKGSISGGSERQWGPLSSSSSLCNEMESPEKVASRDHGSPSAESPVTEVNVFQVPDLPPQELPNHYPENKEVRRFDRRDKSQRAEENVSFCIANGQEHSVENTAVATEISVNGLSNSYISQDSVDTNEGEPLKSNKGGESFFGALIKKGFRDFTKSSRGTDDSESLVFVNGHLIPDRDVKKAEKLSGPIQPGKYWYDKKAGFWGVMGHPCMGIIMPNIEEFKYPLPKNCAAGDTGVFVNGRELNQSDLDLLAKRGLPLTKNKSYLIQITGEVVDEQTGEELDGLGKLAPTVQSAKHGFGMKVPKFLAQSRS